MEDLSTLSELVSILLLVGSLLFVGYEMKQTRAMNLAVLHYNRSALRHENCTALMSNSNMVAIASKTTMKDIEVEGLSPEESATFALNGVCQFAQWEAEFSYIDGGFATRSLQSLKDEVSFWAQEYPVYKQIFQKYIFEDQDLYDPWFLFLDGILGDPKP